MNGKELLEGMSFVHSKYVQEAEFQLPKQQTRQKYINKKFLLIAALIALTVFLMGSAVNALVKMRIRDVKVITHDGTNVGDSATEAVVIHEGEEVRFDQVSDVFIELGSYYPQELPEGYETVFISDAVYQQQTIVYENESGMDISFTIYIPSEASDIEIYDIISKTNVIIGSQDGILYEQSGGYRTLVWIDPKQGFGFTLHTGDSNVDLIAMAEGTAEGDPLVHSRADKTVEAVAELGDYSPTYLPAGFEEQGVLGSPISDGGGWYSYVRKWYVNKSENTRIYFEYETYAIATEDGYKDDAKTVCSFFIPGCDILKGIIVGDEVEIDGMYGIAAGNHIAWADPESHRVFHLTSEDIIGADLLKVAQSIRQNQ